MRGEQLRSQKQSWILCDSNADITHRAELSTRSAAHATPSVGGLRASNTKHPVPPRAPYHWTILDLIPVQQPLPMVVDQECAGAVRKRGDLGVRDGRSKGKKRVGCSVNRTQASRTRLWFRWVDLRVIQPSVRSLHHLPFLCHERLTTGPSIREMYRWEVVG